MRGCMRAVSGFIFTILILAGLAYAALQVYILPKVDSTLADAVRREYLLPPSATVTIKRGSVFDTLEGQVESFYVESNEAQIDALPVEDLKFVAEGVSFDLPQTLLTQRAELKELKNGRLNFKVTEKALSQRWVEQLEGAGLSKVAVKLEPGTADVSGVFSLAMIKVRVGAEGKLSTDGERVRFELTKLSLGDSAVEVGALNAVFSKLAPVIDLGQFKVGMHIDKLSVQKGYVAIQASSRSLDELEQQIKKDDIQKLQDKIDELEQGLPADAPQDEGADQEPGADKSAAPADAPPASDA